MGRVEHSTEERDASGPDEDGLPDTESTLPRVEGDPVHSVVTTPGLTSTTTAVMSMPSTVTVSVASEATPITTPISTGITVPASIPSIITPVTASMVTPALMYPSTAMVTTPISIDITVPAGIPSIITPVTASMVTPALMCPRTVTSVAATPTAPVFSTDSTVTPVMLGTSSTVDVMHSVTQLLDVQRVMMAAQVQAMAAQTVPPLCKFTGEDIHSEDGSFERWIEGFEERAKAMGWKDEQRLFQLKAHLDKTAEHAVRMLSESEKSSYEATVAALEKRFLSLDIEELRGLEFHQLMQDKQGVEEIGICLQKLARKAFPKSSPKEFDRLLKGRFYQALLPKWQRKLGAPKATETFDDLYARARALERHDQQFNVRTGNNKPQASFPQKSASHKEGKQMGGNEQRPEHHINRGPRRGSGQSYPKGGKCWHCNGYGHIERNCPKRGTESPGRTAKISTVATPGIPEMTIRQLEEVLASKRLAAEQNKLSADIGTVTGVTSGTNQVSNSSVDATDAIGPILYLEVSIEGHPVKALVDTGAQSTILSQSMLHEIARHMKLQSRDLPK